MSQSPLLNYWRQAQTKVDGLKVRERVMVLLMSLAVAYMFWDLVMFDPLARAKTSVENELVSVQQNIASMESEEKTILAAVNADPDRDLKRQIANAQQSVTELTQSLETLSLGLIPVDKLTAILHDVLESSGQLQLISLSTLPAEEMQLEADSSDNPNDEEPATAGVYKHKVILTMQGNYLELLKYLQALENMQWRFYWDELHFEEHNYPDAVIQLHVYTLSTDEGLFGV